MEAVLSDIFQVAIIACQMEIVHGLLLQKMAVAQSGMFRVVITV